MLKKLSYLAVLFFLSSSVFASEQNKFLYEQTKLNRQKINLGEQIFNQIANDPNVVEMFKKIYGTNLTANNIIDTLMEYERSQRPYSRFDDYRQGNKDALTAEELRGYQLFNSYGCAACHTGSNFGGTQFKRLGAAKNYMIERKTLLTPADLGLAAVTKKSKDLHVFKVPSMRNVAITAPYYHDGSVKSLDEAVYLMGKYQLGVDIPTQDVNAIVIFLKSLTSKSFEMRNPNAVNSE